MTKKEVEELNDQELIDLYDEVKKFIKELEQESGDK